MSKKKVNKGIKEVAETLANLSPAEIQLLRFASDNNNQVAYSKT